MRSCASQKSVADSVFENAAISHRRNCQPRHLIQCFRRPESSRQLLTGFGQELLSLLEVLASRHVTQHDGVDDAVALVDLRDGCFSRKLLAVLSNTGYLAS